jgi:hypothetical protein
VASWFQVRRVLEAAGLKEEVTAALLRQAGLPQQASSSSDKEVQALFTGPV